MTEMFEAADSITDVDNYLQEPYEIWRFKVDRDKALRKGISIDAIVLLSVTLSVVRWLILLT